MKTVPGVREAIEQKEWGLADTQIVRVGKVLDDKAGVVTQLVSDHPHLFEMGGENYHVDFTAWDYQRGHEGDPLPDEDRGPPRDRAGGGPQRELTGEKASGTVKFFNATKGFGFITRDDGQPDAFVHISAVERAGMISLNEGDRIEFELEVDRRGKTAAVNLIPIQ